MHWCVSSEDQFDIHTEWMESKSSVIMEQSTANELRLHFENAVHCATELAYCIAARALPHQLKK